MQDIYIGDTGKGFPLVLVHGFLGSSKMWEPQIKVLKKNYRVITPDLPGFGKSNKAKLYNNINDMAQTILDCLKKKKIDKFYLLGHSMGGMIAQEMAKIAGEKIFKLVCYSTGAIGNIPVNARGDVVKGDVVIKPYSEVAKTRQVVAEKPQVEEKSEA